MSLPRPRAHPARLACLWAAAWFAIPSLAQASPGLGGTRNLGMGGASRASTSGAEAMLVNPANMGFTRQLEIQPLYQGNIETNTHGAGLLAMDSLLNERVALGFGYAMTYGGPKATYIDSATGKERTLQLAHAAHEVGIPLAINVVRGWLAFGVRPKFQYSVLRFADDNGQRQDARKQQLKFGLDLALTFSAKQYVTLAIVAQNLTGPAPSQVTLDLAPLTIMDGSLSRGRVSPLSDYPRSVAHGLAVFPTRRPGFSINFDGMYDFTTYRTADDKFTRMVFSGGVEYSIREVVPLRLGGYWDGRGRGKEDDRGYISFGGGYYTNPGKGQVGLNFGLGFSRQITGPSPDTTLAITLGVLLNPNR
jgi:hypothetical protein